MIKKIALALCFCFALFVSNIKASQASRDELIGERFKIATNIVLSAVITFYYSMVDSNQLNQNIKEWTVDGLAAFNTVWRTILFGIGNYYDYSYIPDHRAKESDYLPADGSALMPKAIERGIMTDEQIESLKRKIVSIQTSAAMVTYNTRYDDVIIKRFFDTRKSLTDYLSDVTATMLSCLNIVMRNFVYFYTIPVYLKRVNGYVIDHLPRQQTFSQFVYGRTGSIILAHLAFFLADAFLKHAVMSVKHTVCQFTPIAPDLHVFRFDDCTTCYFGTNLFGRNGPLGTFFTAIREYALALQDRMAKFTADYAQAIGNSMQIAEKMSRDEAQKAFSYPALEPATPHGTMPFCGAANPYCIYR